MKPLLRHLARPAPVAALTATALTLGLYHDALRLPLFADDLVQIPWLQSATWAQLWSSPSPYGYYRPLWYSLWRILGLLAGGLHPFELHLVNLISHALAAWLVGLLAVRWAKPPDDADTWWCACFATAIFAAFPFAREAVAWPGAVYNPWVSALAAASALAYERARLTQRPRWLLVTCVCTLLAPFTYEVGLLVGLLILLVEVVGLLSRRWARTRAWWAALCVGLSVIAFVAWREVRTGGVSTYGLTPAQLRPNISLLAQALIYPAAPLAQRIASTMGLGAELSLWLVALPLLGLLVWAAVRRAPAGLWLGMGWFALFSLPPLVTMEAAWFALAPRYLYIPAVGVSLAWTAALGRLLPCVSRPWRRLVVAVLAATALLAPASVFVRQGMRLYRLAGDALWEAVAVAERERPVLFVNLPSRIVPSVRTYPLGFEGVTPLPKRVTAEQLVAVHTGLESAAEAAACAIVASDRPPGYTYEPFGRPSGWEELASAVRRSRAVFLTRYEPQRILLAEAGGPVAPSDPATALAHFGTAVALVRATAACDECGEVRLEAIWQLVSAPEADATVFVHLLGGGGALVAQADGYPLGGMLPFWLWQPGEAMHDVRTFAPVPRGAYAIRIGLWEPATGQHWPAAGHPNGVVLIPLECP